MATLIPLMGALSLLSMTGGVPSLSDPAESVDSDAAWILARTMHSTRTAVETASLDGATSWINSRPLSVADLRGKVVVVQFWTYSCVNWLRTLPSLRALASQYQRFGLVLIGVHSPEFQFEQRPENVLQAVRERGITYPVAIDSNHEIWRAFGNNYWPSLYVFDAQGRLRHQQFGEQGSEESASVIRRLLVETGADPGIPRAAAARGTGVEAAADWDNLQSPENYLGYERTRNFLSSGGVVRDHLHVYSAPKSLRPNEWSLSGQWNIGAESIVLGRAPGRIAYAFHARDVNLVMGPGQRGKPVRFRIRVDGQPPGDSHGIDIDREGNGVISAPRLYQLIRQTGPIVDRRVEIEFLDSGVEAYSLAFG